MSYRRNSLHDSNLSTKHYAVLGRDRYITYWITAFDELQAGKANEGEQGWSITLLGGDKGLELTFNLPSPTPQIPPIVYGSGN